LAVKYLAGERLIGTAAEREALTTGLNLVNTGDGGTTYNLTNYNNATGFANSSKSGFGRCIDIGTGANPTSVDPPTHYFSNTFTAQNWIGTGNYCMGCWFKLIDSGGDQYFFYLDSTAGSNGILAYHWSANLFRMNINAGGNGSANTASANDAENDGGWHHYMIERSGSTTTLYLDNSSKATWSNSGEFASFDRFQVGNWWEGNLDEIFFMNRVATSAEKSSMQSGVISGISSMYSDSALKLYYNCDNTIAYPNLSNGTIFEESDTGKHQMFDGTDTWNEIT